MKWLNHIFHHIDQSSDSTLMSLREHFASFLTLLERNNEVLKAISDMEEKSLGGYLFDMKYIHTVLEEIESGVLEIVECMVSLGGEKYAVLRDTCRTISRKIEFILPGSTGIEEDAFTIPLEELDRDRAHSVGGKSAQLGEMKTKLGMPVPDGFAITAWAYKHFMDRNDLQSRIYDRIKSLDFNCYEDLVRVSDELSAMVKGCPVPEDLAEAIHVSSAHLTERTGAGNFALRSSAVCEDTQFSFAGQYSTFLNVPEDQIVDRYRAVIASMFTPKAIYYFLSHSMTEAELAMSVCCMEMIDAQSSGVIYTRNPVDPTGENVMISSIFGIGKYLVDGTLTPDSFLVNRESHEIAESYIARKPVRLVLDERDGTVEEAVPENQQMSASINDEQARYLTAFALALEDHYSFPLDIEWATDPAGVIFLLQVRPLQIIDRKAHNETLDEPQLDVLMTGGSTVCPGAGGGLIYHAETLKDLAEIPDGAVLVTSHPFPGLITIMERVSAIVTEVGGVASHMAALAREYLVPTLAGIENASRLPAGESVTVDATGRKIYLGVSDNFIKERRIKSGQDDDILILNILKRVLETVSPLNLLHPNDPQFTPEYCRTFHDITRYCHQKSMDEMFAEASSLRSEETVGLKLKSDLPLQLYIIDIESGKDTRERRWIKEDEIESIPLSAFWGGVRYQGWPSHDPPEGMRGLSVVSPSRSGVERERKFSEKSFAIVSREYLCLSLRLGYHFTTIEAMCTEEINKNYIRMQLKAGGATHDRRARRVNLLVDILGAMGFEIISRGDFLDAMISYRPVEAIREKLSKIGRLTMLTKQLDMVLATDAVTRWYTNDIKRQLEL